MCWSLFLTVRHGTVSLAEVLHVALPLFHFLAPRAATALLAAVAQAAKWRKALELLEAEMCPRLGRMLAPGAVSAALTACKVEGAWEAALALWVRQAFGSASVRSAALGSFASSTRWELALQLLEADDRSMRCEESEMLLVSALGGLSRVRRWREALCLRADSARFAGPAAASLVWRATEVSGRHLELQRWSGQDWLGSGGGGDVRQRRRTSAQLLLRPMVQSGPWDQALRRRVLAPALVQLLALQGTAADVPRLRERSGRLRSCELEGTSDLGASARELWPPLSLWDRSGLDVLKPQAGAKATATVATEEVLRASLAQLAEVGRAKGDRMGCRVCDSRACCFD
ncbi:unnamed protein product [Effrenium voratum]|nr:unnamed protein product [Effrenium voratum]